MGKYEATTTARELLSPRTRAYLYRLMIAGGAVALFYGFMSGEEIGVWLAFAGVALGTTSGLAHANIPTTEA